MRLRPQIGYLATGVPASACTLPSSPPQGLVGADLLVRGRCIAKERHKLGLTSLNMTLYKIGYDMGWLELVGSIKL